MMKYILFPVFLLISISSKTLAQSDTIILNNGEKMEVFVGPVTKPPMFPGGKKEMQKFIVKYMIPPSYEILQTSHTKVFVIFIISPDGSILNVHHTKGDECPECVKAAVDVIKLMPKWEPAENNGTPVNIQVVLPIAF
jgi:hypothetical protein